jgi:hypothetical protein
VPERVAVVDEDRVDAGLARPAGHRGRDRGLAGHRRRRLDPPAEQRADERFVDERVADRAPALGGELRQPAEVPVPQGERSIALSP